MPDPTDPTDPDEFEDEGEQDEYDLETPEADAVEQHREVSRHRDEPLAVRQLGEADPADAAEQRRVVDLDEDDYRE